MKIESIPAGPKYSAVRDQKAQMIEALARCGRNVPGSELRQVELEEAVPPSLSRSGLCPDDGGTHWFVPRGAGSFREEHCPCLSTGKSET